MVNTPIVTKIKTKNTILVSPTYAIVGMKSDLEYMRTLETDVGGGIIYRRKASRLESEATTFIMVIYTEQGTLRECTPSHDY